MKHITTDELKRITAEGLVLQGCGGDPQEWLDGINEMLTEAGILQNGGSFTDISIFEHEGRTNILFPFDDMNPGKLDIGKLAMWRLQTHDKFGGTWLSDYLPNRLGVDMGKAEPAETFEVTVFTYEDGGYDIMAGSFTKRQDAEAFARLLENDGFYSVNMKAVVSGDSEEYSLDVSISLEDAQRNEVAVERFNKFKKDYDLTNEPDPSVPAVSASPGTVSASLNKLHVLSACFDHPEDEHSGWWLGFPTNTGLVQSVLKELGIYGGDVIANRHSAGIKHLADCLSAIMQPDNIDELNYLAVKLNNLSVSDAEMLEAVLESRRHTDSVKDIINIIENIDRFNLQPAYSPEMYAETLLEMAKDDTSEVFRRLEQSDNPDERAFAQYILRLEAHVDEGAYGKYVAEQEKGTFTENGYLTESSGFKEVYRGPEDIPTEYRVFAYPESKQYFRGETNDLAVFVYKVHALAGEYMSDVNSNVRTLKDGSEYYLMLMNSENIHLCEMSSAYRRDSTANGIWFHEDVTPDTKAFVLHVMDCNGSKISGRITEIDHAAQREDIIAHCIGYMHIDAELKNGDKRTYTPVQWAELEPIDRDKVDYWKRRYDMDDIETLESYVIERIEQSESSANRVPPEMILEELNRKFTDKAAPERPELFRIACDAAKDIIVRGDTPVYRLLPDKDELLTPLDVVRHGLIYGSHNAFAVKSEDMDGFLKWAERGTADIVRRAANRDEREKPKSHGQEH